MHASHYIAMFLIAIGVVAILGIDTSATPWTYHIVRSEHFTLNCPTLVSEKTGYRAAAGDTHMIKRIQTWLHEIQSTES